MHILLNGVRRSTLKYDHNDYYYVFYVTFVISTSVISHEIEFIAYSIFCCRFKSFHVVYVLWQSEKEKKKEKHFIFPSKMKGEKSDCIENPLTISIWIIFRRQLHTKQNYLLVYSEQSCVFSIHICDGLDFVNKKVN